MQTPDGAYRTRARWVVACDGANSAVRGMLGLRPRVYDRTEDRWIIIDIVLRGTTWPEERWTWLDARSNHGRAVWRLSLIHIYHRDAAAHQIQGQRQAGQAGADDGDRVRLSARTVHFVRPEIGVEGKLCHRFP